MRVLPHGWLAGILGSVLVGGGGFVGYTMMTPGAGANCEDMGMMNGGMMGMGPGMMGGGGMDDAAMQAHMEEMHARCQAMMSAGTAADGPPAAGTSVEMRQTQFDPRELRVPAGATVTWVNRDAYAHTATSDSGATPLDSGTIAPGASWSHTFTQPGTYDYHCEPHASRGASGTYQGMTGRIIVT